MQIFPNGRLSFTRASQADLDEHGMPMPADNSAVQDIECTITTLEENKKGNYEDGKYRNCQYSVTFNMDDVEDTDGDTFPLALANVMGTFSPCRVGLSHERFGNMGFFEVQRVEYYEITRTIEIWV